MMVIFFMCLALGLHLIKIDYWNTHGALIMKKFIFAVVICALALTGCASSGNSSIEHETQIGIKDKLVKGKTTKDQVKGYYGNPSTVSFSSDGDEQWHYVLTNVKVSGKSFIPFYGLLDNGATSNVKQLIIIFKNDVVEKYMLSNSSTETKSGLLN